MSGIWRIHMPLFSVVIPVYNVEKYLSQCIESVLEQTYTDFELILVDDGSPDSCGKICDAYAEKDSRIRVIHKENGGVSSARLAGAETAVGTYISCVDGDDWVGEKYLECFAECIREYHSEIVCCGFVESYSGKFVENLFPIPSGEYDKIRIKAEVFPMLIEREDCVYFPNNIAGKAVLRELYLPQQMKVDNRIKVGEDSAVTKPCVYRAHSISILPDCLYYYRQNPTSITKNKKAFDMDDPMRIGKHFESQINMTEDDFQSQVYRNVVHLLFNAVTSQFNRKESFRVIVEDIKRYLQEPYYTNAINRCRFRGNWKGSLAKAALKHQWYGLMWLYCHIK